MIQVQYIGKNAKVMSYEGDIFHMKQNQVITVTDEQKDFYLNSSLFKEYVEVKKIKKDEKKDVKKFTKKGVK